jgi:hypothetical protein
MRLEIEGKLIEHVMKFKYLRTAINICYRLSDDVQIKKATPTGYPDA